MSTPFLKLLCAIMALSSVGIPSADANGAIRTRDSFNEGWLFQKGDLPDARFPETDDSSWRKLRLPHDWAIEGPFDVKYNARSGGLPFHGKAWYRKHFSVPMDKKGKVVTLEFDGAMNNSKVWVNGHFLGERPFGYIGFAYDITKHLRWGDDQTNVISVSLSPEDLSSRWYPGAGLYRNTWINYTNPVHVARNGTFVTTPKVDDSSAQVDIAIDVNNQSGAPAKIELRTRILDPEHRPVVSKRTGPFQITGETGSYEQTLRVKKPALWDLDTPHLYTAETTVFVDGKKADLYETTFGIRSIAFDKDTGFSLNGRKVELKGVCLHHDLGPLGAAVNWRATERQLQIMKEMGANAIRTAHNPPSPEQLELCDRLGILVQVEAFDCWEEAKVENGYSKFFDEWHERDLRDLIHRDRNHPSVIMWSIGNEILEQFKGNRGATIAKRLNHICHEEDATRPTTAGFNYYPKAIDNGLAAEIDIVGLNYKPTKYKETLDQHPDWIVYGSETCSVVSSRGTYHLPVEKYEKHESLEVTSYDIVGPKWAYPPDIEFHYLSELPQVLGEFVWTGFDYLGEPTPYGGRDNSTNGYWNDDWPARSSYFGIVDLCGFPKDRYYMYQSQWSDEPMVHLLPHWNWEGHEGQTIPVYSYTNCDEAELFLNGKSLGRRIKGVDTSEIFVKFNSFDGPTFNSKYRLSWEVPYQPGTLKVVGYKDGKAICEKSISTAATAAQVSLSPDRKVIKSDGYDISFITVRIEDQDGNLVPESDNLVTFEIEGPGEIAAVGNGNPATTESFQASHRKAFNGLCMLFLKSKPGESGSIKVTAHSQGLTSASTSISAEAL
ncbi:beta-galactosidase GalB [Pelagicoccus mobilis]|uniref:DUF4982 domain-containing protein n=1 Tax=Pelagicoccus mobilis TaxID=415221 RepID=A0A934VMK7_9BACT|nr:beta-galactosidase GalB [Pelagicoccus mobilis]MBK1875287.1 DUF4982 domain-containing protein [Pelagicoccus mobilis]